MKKFLLTFGLVLISLNVHAETFLDSPNLVRSLSKLKDGECRELSVDKETNTYHGVCRKGKELWEVKIQVLNKIEK